MNIKMKFFLYTLLLKQLSGCVTVTDNTRERNQPKMPKQIDITDQIDDCSMITKLFEENMAEAKITVSKERTKTAFIYEATAYEKYYAIVVKPKDDNTNKWNEVLKGSIFKCKSNETEMDLIIKQ